MKWRKGRKRRKGVDVKNVRDSEESTWYGWKNTPGTSRKIASQKKRANNADHIAP